jgi:5'-nucleotidase
VKSRALFFSAIAGNNEAFMMLSIPADLSRTRILVTNDDGVQARGLRVLAQIARALSDDVWVVAPEVEQSGAGHSLSLHQPIRVRKISARRYAISGTPTDCVLLAAMEIIPRRKPIGLVLSGINRGLNVAEDVTYSGTVAAAMEGTLLEIPSLAFSLQWHEREALHWDTAAHYARQAVEMLRGFRMDTASFVSVNIPHLPVEAVLGVALARQGRRRIADKLERRLDPKGRPYYWIGSPNVERIEQAQDTDDALVAAGYVAVTPLSLDLTNREMLHALRRHAGERVAP